MSITLRITLDVTIPGLPASVPDLDHVGLDELEWIVRDAQRGGAGVTLHAITTEGRDHPGVGETVLANLIRQHGGGDTAPDLIGTDDVDPGDGWILVERGDDGRPWYSSHPSPLAAMRYHLDQEGAEYWTAVVIVSTEHGGPVDPDDVEAGHTLTAADGRPTWYDDAE